MQTIGQIQLYLPNCSPIMAQSTCTYIRKHHHHHVQPFHGAAAANLRVNDVRQLLRFADHVGSSGPPAEYNVLYLSFHETPALPLMQSMSRER